MLAACHSPHARHSTVVAEPVPQAEEPTQPAPVVLHDVRNDVYFDSGQKLYCYRERAEWVCCAQLPDWIRFDPSHAVRVEQFPQEETARERPDKERVELEVLERVPKDWYVPHGTKDPDRH